MRINVWVVFILFMVEFLHATLIVHIQSPWRDDANKEGYVLHILGSAGGGYNPSFGENSLTAATDEGDGWFSYTWNKNVADFQDWQSFSVSIYPNTPDQNFNNNNGVAWKKDGDFKMQTLFGSDTEVWLYTDTKDLSYTKSYVAPGSKIVWFKSPWGNKALPQMVFGKDSVMMRFMFDDKKTCGWFYGAITPTMIKNNPLQSAHFLRLNTSHMTIPENGVVELSSAFLVSDTIFVDGTVKEPIVDVKIGELGECFDSTRVLHIYHPWRNNSTYKDSAVYISIGNNILNNPTVTSKKGEFPYWWHYEFSSSTVASAAWSSASAVFNIYRRQNEWPQVTYFKDNERPLASSLFPTGVYETWLFTRNNGAFDLSFSPLEPKTVRLLSPWDNMSPSMIVADDTVKMGPIPDTCGWYEGTFYKHTDNWEVQFKQSFGMEYYSNEGLMGEDKGFGSPIALDSMIFLYDTIWVYPYPLSGSSPKFSDMYPERLGICPTMKISAMLLDWAGESYDDSIDVDFGGIYGGNDYTTVTFGGETFKTCGGLATGMVQDTLSDMGLPMRVDSLKFPWEKCSAGHEIEKWFVPVTLATDANGKEYTNATCRDIDLTLDAEGFWLADITEAGSCNDPKNPGFYPLDDFEYLDSAKTIKNPKFDWDVQGCKHNYSFSMKINAQFKYIKGQYFEFRGDDDVWVFINNKLVVDIGGCHSPIEGAVNLDTLNLTEGEEYPFQIFFSERNAVGSNFKMRTSINLQTQKTYFPVNKKNPNGVIEYELLQLLIDESLSCDVSSVSKIDTTYAQSSFRLIGGDLPKDGIFLEPGLNYGGIYINENMAGFAIDTSAFVNARMLNPGKYMLICSLASDENQFQIISFTVPEYPLPDIAFVDVFGITDSLTLDPKGLSLRGDSLWQGDYKNDTLLAHVTYPDTVPLKIVLLFGKTPCGNMESSSNVNCAVTLNINTKYPLSFLDESNQRIKTITTDSLGYASFYVVGDSATEDAYFTIEGNGVANRIHWTDINFKEPPVPFAVSAKMYDANGDGIADSLVIPFNKTFDKVVPDTISWIFGGSKFHTTADMKNIWKLVQKDSVIILYDSLGLQNNVFTGNVDGLYAGTLSYHYTYNDEDSGEEVQLTMNSQIEDKVGAIILGASIEPRSSDISIVTINLSEGTDSKDIDGKNAFIFYRDSLNFMDSLRISSSDKNSNGNVFKLFFQKTGNLTLPEVGDFVKLAPNEFKDYNKNTPHINNPKVRIVGEQRTQIKAPGVVAINESIEWHNKKSIVPVIVPTGKSVQDIIDSLGYPGLLLNFNIGELANSAIMNLENAASKDSALAEIKINWENYYYSHLGSFVDKEKGIIACNDKEIFYNALAPEKSNCLDNPGNVFFEWNARSEKGRLVGTGAYIAKMKVKIKNGKETAGKSDDTFTIGIKRKK